VSKALLISKKNAMGVLRRSIGIDPFEMSRKECG
jgi:hypothetical protein